LSNEDASGSDIIEEMLDWRSPYYAVRDEQSELVGFFSFGTSCLVWSSDEPGLYVDKERKTIAIGLGMRPDLTGRGLGLAFVQAGLDFARQASVPTTFMLLVYTWNERAIRVYERAGSACASSR
jgi:ribosomal-protein-alanine N-acetyltransferase